MAEKLDSGAMASLKPISAENGRGWPRAVLRRWGLVVLVGAILGGLAAFAVSLVVPPVYKATAQIFVAPAAEPAVALQEVVLGQNLAKSYVQLAGADVVLEPAMKRVGWSDLKSFRERTTIAQVRDTFVITISFELNDATRAAAAANAIAETFVAQSGKLQSSLRGALTIWQPANAPAETDSPKLVLNTALGATLGALASALFIAFAPTRKSEDRLLLEQSV
jgi:capsular polysaccharide biosynthesis protein